MRNTSKSLLHSQLVTPSRQWSKIGTEHAQEYRTTTVMPTKFSLRNISYYNNHTHKNTSCATTTTVVTKAAYAYDAFLTSHTSYIHLFPPQTLQGLCSGFKGTHAMHMSAHNPSRGGVCTKPCCPPPPFVTYPSVMGRWAITFGVPKGELGFAVITLTLRFLAPHTNLVKFL